VGRVANNANGVVQNRREDPSNDLASLASAASTCAVSFARDSELILL